MSVNQHPRSRKGEAPTMAHGTAHAAAPAPSLESALRVLARALAPEVAALVVEALQAAPPSSSAAKWQEEAAACKARGLARKTCAGWRADGRLPWRRAGRIIVVDVAAVDALIEGLPTQGAAADAEPEDAFDRELQSGRLRVVGGRR